MKIQIADYSDGSWRVTIEDEQGGCTIGFVASIPEVLRVVEERLRSLPLPDRRVGCFEASAT